MPVFFSHYIILFLGIKWAKTWNIGNYIYGFIIAFLVLKTNLIINGLKMFFWGYYPQAGILHPYFLAYVLFLPMVYLTLLFQALSANRRNALRTNHIRYVLLAFFIFAISIIDFIPNYGIELYPFGYLPTLLFTLIIAYAAVKHHLMDIHIVIKRSIVYSISIATISIAYLLSVFILERITQGILGYHSILISIVMAFVLGLLFIPIRHRVQEIMDRYFFKGSQLEIAEQNEQLRQEVTRAEKHKIVATLASGIAHEIRNPLTSLKTFHEHFPDKKDDPEFIEKFNKIASRELGRIENLTQELLDFAKPSPLELGQHDLNTVIEETLDLISNHIQKHNIQLEKNLTTDPWALMIDKNQIKQVLLNIFLNAIDAMPEGGKLIVETEVTGVKDYRIKGSEDLRKTGSEDQRIKGSKDQASNPIPLNPKPLNPTPSNPIIPSTPHFLITIQDTGVGIPKEHLKHIFEPFFSKKDNGTGLGLAIVKGIIEKHKGKIKVNSTLGKGTEFIIELPL